MHQYMLAADPPESSFTENNLGFPVDANLNRRVLCLCCKEGQQHPVVELGKVENYHQQLGRSNACLLLSTEMHNWNTVFISRLLSTRELQVCWRESRKGPKR